MHLDELPSDKNAENGAQKSYRTVVRHWTVLQGPWKEQTQFVGKEVIGTARCVALGATNFLC